MLEISIIRNNRVVYSYDSLTRKQQKKLYNIAVVSLAMNMSFSGNMSAWNTFGISPVLIYAILGGLILMYFTKQVFSEDELNLKNIMQNILWLLLALIPLGFLIF